MSRDQVSIVSVVLRQPHLAHSARAELLDDLVRAESCSALHARKRTRKHCRLPQTPTQLSKEQVDPFTAMYDGSNHPVQPLTERTLFFDESPLPNRRISVRSSSKQPGQPPPLPKEVPPKPPPSISLPLDGPPLHISWLQLVLL